MAKPKSTRRVGVSKAGKVYETKKPKGVVDRILKKLNK